MNDAQNAVLEQARRDGVTQVRVVFIDYNGLARARSIATHALDHAFVRGVNFSSPTVDFNSRDVFPPDAAFDLTSPDFWAVPDASTYAPAPGAPADAILLADLYDAAGDPWPGCARTALRAVVARAQANGIEFQVGFEPEAYLFQPDGADIAFAGLAQFATLDGLDIQKSFVDDLVEYLGRAGVHVSQWSEEYGPGQVEINLPHNAAVRSADALVLFKIAFRALARRHGLLGSFMPKPFDGHAGSGLHVHISCVPAGGEPANLFDDSTDTEMALSPLGRQALAGILAHGEALVALGASTVNSYKRFLPGSWAPTHIMYGYASRAAFVRVLERETPRRLELRSGDGACNPYLYLTGVLAAALDGIEHELDPGPSIAGDVGSMGLEAEKRGARSLPRTLERALEALERDTVICEALGGIIAGEYLKIKRSEWEAFAAHVGAWDRDWYLQRY